MAEQQGIQKRKKTKGNKKTGQQQGERIIKGNKADQQGIQSERREKGNKKTEQQQW